ncbi:hypothetical protein [Pseudofrankia sp. BMG5.37]|uniref:hypothetical protein n=1 Tax=Pseudofrankia sp. BMG5.37 TaxID=3050035 RepID=UPI0008D9F25D|nr:hypothetical protein [Pseudofrankia sp. BMG5.37]OHV43535.1 hypothetical protein BCD48_27535 [Pseudofrankia sp. BMG5.36]
MRNTTHPATSVTSHDRPIGMATRCPAGSDIDVGPGALHAILGVASSATDDLDAPVRHPSTTDLSRFGKPSLCYTFVRVDQTGTAFDVMQNTRAPDPNQ